MTGGKVAEEPEGEDDTVNQEEPQEINAGESVNTTRKSSTDIVKELEELHTFEEERSALVQSMESQHKAKGARRRHIVEELRSLQDELKAIQKQLLEKEERVITLHAEYEAIAVEMSSMNREIGEGQNVLEEIRQRIEELSKVWIYIGADGNIEVEGMQQMSTFSVSKKEEEAYFFNLVQRPDAEEWTIKVLKSIAKMHLMVKECKKLNMNYEVIFETESLQKFYEENNNN